MKVSDTEWQWDRNKLTIYFTAEKRVDFRALVRDLASLFRTRIELRQIGVRDEAARLSGVGRCGREYCCSTWLKELSPVNLGLAKDQHLSLNPSQISGGCGRLLCCLKYEHEFYVTARKRFPKEGKTLQTLAGPRRWSRSTSSASGCFSGARSTARASSRWCSCARRWRRASGAEAGTGPGRHGRRSRSPSRGRRAAHRRARARDGGPRRAPRRRGPATGAGGRRPPEAPASGPEARAVRPPPPRARARGGGRSVAPVHPWPPES